MRAASCTDNLRSTHTVAEVANLPQMPFSKWCGEARPSCSTFVLGSALEQRQSAQFASVHAIPFFREEQATKRGFLSMIEQQIAFLIIEAGDQFLQLVF